MKVDDKQLDRWLKDAQNEEVPLGTETRYMRGLEEKLSTSRTDPWFFLKGGWAVVGTTAVLLLSLGVAWAFPTVRSFVLDRLETIPSVDRSAETAEPPPASEPYDFSLDASAEARDASVRATDAALWADAHDAAVRVRNETRHRRRRPRRSADALTREADAHQRALSYRGTNNQRALQLWKENRRAFPKGALRHETDFHIVEMLVKLERHAEATREAKRFLKRYPKSAKAAEVRRALEQASKP